MDEYLAVVAREQLEAKFSTNLEVNDDNLLTMRNMPWLELGELPVSYNTHKSEAFQVYMVPKQEPPYSMIVMFDNWSAKYDIKQAKKEYVQTQLNARGITELDIINTCEQAS